MTPEEFKEQFLIAQNSLGNNLQALADLTATLSLLLGNSIEDFNRMNQVVDTYVNQASNSSVDSSQE